MNIADFLHNRKWRTIQNYTYSFGASVVLIGALAKLEHWPMASGFLMTGLGMEALIFFISAFEPLVDNPDWKRIYPQLRDGDEPQRSLDLYKIFDKQFVTKGGDGGSISIKDLPAEQIKKLNDSFEKLSEAANGIKKISDATAATEKFVTNLENASQSIESVVNTNLKVSASIDKNTQDISESYKSAAERIKLSSDQASAGIVQSSGELSNSIKLTGEYIKASGDKASAGIVQSVNDLSTSFKVTGEGIKASGEKANAGIIQSISDLSTSLKQTGDSLKSSGEKASTGMAQSVNELSVSIKATADGLKSTGEKFNSDTKEASKVFGEKLQKSASDLNDTYIKVSDSLSNGFKKLENSSGKYVENIDKLNKNLGALNAAYELHLKGAGKVEEVVKDYSTSVGEIGKLLHSSVEETRKFNESTKEINENIQALNKVYGRMLGALNTKK